MHGFQCWDIGERPFLGPWFCVPWKSKNIYGKTMFGSNEIKNGSHKTYSKTLLFSSSFHMSGAGPIRTWLPVMPWRPGHISLAVVTPWSFRQVSTIHWNGRLNWKRPGKLPNLPSRFKLPSECHGQPASQHFSIFCFSSSGCHRRGWHRRTWWTQTSESSDREVGERQGWTPWETCTFVRGIFALYVNLYLCKTEHCCVVLLESRYSLSRGGESKTLHQVQEDSGWWAWRRLRLVLQRPRRRQPAISTDLLSGNCFQSFMRPCDSPLLGQ